jgi:GcrA cell cycle regulator
MTWTEARLARLAEMWGAGMSASAIGEALSVSRSAVLGKLHRLKLLKTRAGASAPRRYDPTSSASPAGPAARPTPAAPRSASRREAPTPPVSPWREAAFQPLAGSAPRPWLTREAGECAFPVGGEGEGILSCCAPVEGCGAYCPAHRGVVFRSTTAAAREAEQKRWAEAVERWAA